jgi:hypothetical protein
MTMKKITVVFGVNDQKQFNKWEDALRYLRTQFPSCVFFDRECKNELGEASEPEKAYVYESMQSFNDGDSLICKIDCE